MICVCQVTLCFLLEECHEKHCKFPEVVYKPYGNIHSITKVKRSEMTLGICFRYVT